jgi:hypothetical protein
MTEPTGGSNGDPGVGRNPLEGFSWSAPTEDAPYQPTIAEPAEQLTTRLSPVPAAPSGSGAGFPGAPAGVPDTAGKPWWKRPLTWAIAGGVIVLAVIGLVIALSRGGSPAPAVTLPASTVTLSQPTPTVSPSPLPADATAFLKAQPTKVLGYALVSAVRDPAPPSGAVESWRLGYSDGSSAAPLSVYAEQYPDGPSATSAIGSYLDPAVVASATPAPTAAATSPSATATPSASTSAASAASTPAAPELGPVTVAGQSTGTYYFVQNSDKTETVVWFNGTGLFVAKGPAGLMKAFFLAYPL